MTAPYAPPPQINPIQLLSTLAQIQSSRRQIDLSEREFAENKKQFAARLGMDEKSQSTKTLLDMLDRVGAASSESRTALAGLADIIFPGDSQKKNLLLQYGANAPETLQMLQQQAAGRGMKAMQGTPQGQQVDREAATVAATGMNQGQVQGSGLGAMLGAAAQGQVTPAMGQDMAQFTANRQNPLEALINRSIAGNPESVGRMASIQAGTGLSASQAAQTDIGRGDVEARFAEIRQNSQFHAMEIAERLATAKLQGGITPQMQKDGITQMIELQKLIPDPKAAPETRTTSKAIFNHIAKSLGLDDLMYGDKTDDAAAGTRQKILETLGAAGGSPNPPPPQGGPPGVVQQSNPFATGNPLNPFIIRPPQ